MATHCWPGTGPGVTNSKLQLDALTGARGIAAWYVVLYHIRLSFADSIPAPIMHFLAKGYLAVDLFFVLSGFVMWLTYGQKFARDGLSAAPEFYIKRVARIYPLHIFVLISVLLYVAMLWITGRYNPATYPITEFPLHVFLVQNWGMTANLAWNDPDWSISTEMAAYLIFPLVAVTLNSVKLNRIAILGLLATLAIALDMYMRARGAPNIGYDITKTGLTRCLAEFFTGVLVCILWRQARLNSSRFITTLTLAVASMLAGFWHAGVIRETLAVPLIGAATVYLLATTSAAKHNPLASHFLTSVGDVSYSTYLVHYPLWVVFKLIFVRDVNHVTLPLMFLYLVFTALASAILYRLIEQPGRTLFQTLGQNVIATRIRNRQPQLD
jgi:peptidoglycan/LPS O-acetylase OafA/YrhL